jgi:hypothetical protein
VDEACWPFETFCFPELGLNEDRVEEGSTIGEDCSPDVPTYVGCEGLTNDMYLLLIEGFWDLEEAFVIVTLISKHCPD